MCDWKEQITSLKQEILSYGVLSIRQLKFEAVEFMARERASLLFSGIRLIVLLLVLFFASAFMALFLNAQFHSAYLGFGFVALGWLVLLILVSFFSKSLRRKMFDDYTDKNIPS